MFRNIASSPRVRLKLRHGILARWHTGTAHLRTVRIDLEQKIVRVCGNQRRRSKNSAPPPTFGGSLRRSIVLARCATIVLGVAIVLLDGYLREPH